AHARRNHAQDGIGRSARRERHDHPYRTRGIVLGHGPAKRGGPAGHEQHKADARKRQLHDLASSRLGGAGCSEGARPRQYRAACGLWLIMDRPKRAAAGMRPRVPPSALPLLPWRTAMSQHLDRTRTIERMKAALHLAPAATAVVTIDCPRGNLHPAIASLPVPEPHCHRVVEATNRLVAAARALAIPIVHVSTVYEAPLLANHPVERAMLAAKESFTPHRRSDFARHKRPGSVEA